MKINEIFYSIQGEGFFSGTPAVFVRFAGCNLSCKFCDTDHDSSYQEMEPEDILAEVLELAPKCKNVIFTGGEPLLQLNEKILDLFFKLGYFIHVESNGTIEVTGDMKYKINWLTISPKENWKQKKGDELKLVYTGQDLDEYYLQSNFTHYYLQPCSGENTQECIKLCKENPIWKLSIQLQKILKIR